MPRTYLPPPKRSRRRSWHTLTPRLDRQVVPGWFQPPRQSWPAPKMPSRALAWGLALSIQLWVALGLIVMAVAP